MAELLVFLALVFGVAGVTAVLAIVGATLLNWAVSLSPGNDAALPSHYSGALNVSSERFPGHCPECGTNNDPESTICDDCSARLPSSGRRRRTRGRENANAHLKE